MDRSLQNTHAKLVARDIQRLTQSPTESNSFSLLGGACVSRVETVGTIVSRDLTPKFLKFGVDDGTGCVTCVLWLNQLTSSYFSRWDPDTILLLASAARKQAAAIRIGAVARVRGRVGSYRGVMQITATVVVVERDPNAEILHWLECLRLGQSCYRIQS
ncbi:Nucleic acid-binding OB-fold [Arabidopsis suecica]|uniref:Nucleic acid-binding OB-fold n=1 Tax=Arabidopsis suecica TaxID=45249 RepID=A0A8T2H1A9_ARASU|nr:Nucleic acid-binding OB-fold [Arabidopsis suecica]